MIEMTASATSSVRVRSPRAADLAPLLAGPEVTVTAEGTTACRFPGCPASADIAETAFGYGIVLHEVIPMNVSLEDAYMALVKDHIEYQADPYSSRRRAAA